MTDDLGEEFGPAHQFAPLESPRAGLREAAARIRAHLLLIDKYLSAIERDLEVLDPPRGSPGATVRPPDPPASKVPSIPVSKPQGGSKSWKSAR